MSTMTTFFLQMNRAAAPADPKIDYLADLWRVKRGQLPYHTPELVERGLVHVGRNLTLTAHGERALRYLSAVWSKENRT